MLLGVCGGIAAYKAVELCRRLVEAGAFVTPVMTEDATRFIGSVTLSAVASTKALTSLWTETDPIPHVALGRAADAVVVAPATARLLGSYAAGISHDLLTATLLATRAPVLLCPAMHAEMWEHPATQDNVAVLRRRGVTVLDPDSGRLAGGDEGQGRLPDTPTIAAAVERLFRPLDLSGRRVVVTAGGTREAVDPVRYLGNRSSGKQGYAIAAEAAARGAQVVVITTVDRPDPPGVDTVVRVETADEMERAVLDASSGASAVVMTAAVADFRPKMAAPVKLPKEDGPPEIVLEPTTDILAALGRRRRPGQVLVGFAAESGPGRERAAAKLRNKKLDLIVVNDVTAPGSGFGHDTNQASLLEAGGNWVDLPLLDKRQLASLVLDVVARRLAATEGEPR